ncbi:putative uncharacterized protein C2orf48 isoform X4 [Symphalangus syndactylus]|uniref:putative uncharacterized protein C2orf48 isoform X4 n=1 Tax=Symphalangus syndactylus TaxID=9590 RepID=UPI0030061D5C
MESRPSRRQHASEGDGDQSPTQCAGMRSSGRSDQPYVLRGKPLPLRVRCYSGCASGSRRQSQLSAIINTEDFSDRMCGGSSGRKPGRRFLWPSRHQKSAHRRCEGLDVPWCQCNREASKMLCMGQVLVFATETGLRPLLFTLL